MDQSELTVPDPRRPAPGVHWGDVEAIMKPTGPAIHGTGSSGNSPDAQSFWDGDDMPLAGLAPYGDR